MLMDFCDEYEDIVIPVSSIYSMLEHNRINDELWNCYKFNLTANENGILKRVGYYDEKEILLPDSNEYQEKHKKQL